MPVLKNPKHFPGVDKLPDYAQQVLEFFYPPDQVIPSTLLAGVPPGEIAGLRAGGKAMLEKLKASGVLPSYEHGGKGVPLPPELMNVLEFAQKRYPRLFGHVLNISDVPEVMGDKGSGDVLVKGLQQRLGGTKFSSLSVNPLHRYPSQRNFANTVGHELLHTADQIADPNFAEKYRFANTLPGGYGANSAEIRARNQGARFAEKFAEQAPPPPPDVVDWLKKTLGL